MGKLSYANVVATLCLFALVGGGAIAVGQSGGGATTTVIACVKKKGGAMRIVSRARCRKTERVLRWNLQGRSGAPGTAGVAGTAGAAGDALPSGAVAFYDLSSCPAGWTPYEAARGRYVVGVPSGGAMGAAVGTPLGNQENRAAGRHNHPIADPGHTHDVSVRTNIVAGNVTARTVVGNQAAVLPGVVLPTLAAGTGITVSDSTGAAGIAGTSAPYVQLLACRKG